MKIKLRKLASLVLAVLFVLALAGQPVIAQFTIAPIDENLSRTYKGQSTSDEFTVSVSKLAQSGSFADFTFYGSICPKKSPNSPFGDELCTAFSTIKTKGEVLNNTAGGEVWVFKDPFIKATLAPQRGYLSVKGYPTVRVFRFLKGG